MTFKQNIPTHARTQLQTHTHILVHVTLEITEMEFQAFLKSDRWIFFDIGRECIVSRRGSVSKPPPAGFSSNLWQAEVRVAPRAALPLLPYGGELFDHVVRSSSYQYPL